ncbi:MAG: alpha/beta hydrolase, partial [Verrucomicrobiales bacterium]
QEPLWERLSEIKVPVLWVVGGRDEKFRTLGERAVSGIPGARLAVLEEAAHRVPWEVAAEFSGVVAEFLAEGTGNCAG